MMRKIIGIGIGILALGFVIYFGVLYKATYSEGVRSGKLIKFSHKGVIFKTWEGELSQGISGAQIFSFSVLDSQQDVVNQLKEMEGSYVKVNYVERYKTFPWWGDTQYFIVSVKKDESPFKIK